MSTQDVGHAESKDWSFDSIEFNALVNNHDKNIKANPVPRRDQEIFSSDFKKIGNIMRLFFEIFLMTGIAALVVLALAAYQKDVDFSGLAITLVIVTAVISIATWKMGDILHAKSEEVLKLSDHMIEEIIRGKDPEFGQRAAQRSQDMSKHITALTAAREELIPVFNSVKAKNPSFTYTIDETGVNIGGSKAM